MIKLIEKLSDPSLSIEELKSALNITDVFHSKLSNQISEETAFLFLDNKLTYDQASSIMNHLFMIWMSKPYTEDFGNISWFVYEIFDKADEHYDEGDSSKSSNYARKHLETLLSKKD